MKSRFGVIQFLLLSLIIMSGWQSTNCVDAEEKDVPGDPLTKQKSDNNGRAANGHRKKRTVLCVEDERTVYVLEKPHSFSKRIGILSPGARISSFEKVKDFYCINFQDRKGYIFKDFCQLKEAWPSSQQNPSPESRQKDPFVIKKRVVKRKKEATKKPGRPKEPKLSSSKLIDQAVAKIKGNVKTKKKKKKDHHLGKAISSIRNRVNTSGTAGSRSPSTEGISIRIYQIEVEERIKSNWQYPVAQTHPAKRKDLVATVVVQVRKDGTILKSWLIQRSSTAVFDASVIKAVNRSNPLPPFPKSYNKSRDEMEIRFNLSELSD